MDRLDKILVSQNVCARKEASKLIRQGLVRVDGEVIKKPDFKLDPEKSSVEVRGQALNFRKNIYLMMNKPAGVVSATEDNLSETVIDLVPAEFKRPGLFPAGRLDKDTVGLIILTDDGEFAHKILSPRKHIYKRYYARLDKTPDESAVKAFGNGIKLDDGTVCLPAKLELTGENSAFVEICEGKFHQVKKMFAACSLKVVYLRRVAVGGLTLDENLREGECRELSKDEKNVIFISK